MDRGRNTHGRDIGGSAQAECAALSNAVSAGVVFGRGIGRAGVGPYVEEVRWRALRYAPRFGKGGRRSVLIAVRGAGRGSCASGRNGSEVSAQWIRGFVERGTLMEGASRRTGLRRGSGETGFAGW